MLRFDLVSSLAPIPRFLEHRVEDRCKENYTCTYTAGANAWRALSFLHHARVEKYPAITKNK